MTICRRGTLCLTVLLLIADCHAEHNAATDWQQQVRELIANHELDAALGMVDERLEQSAGDLEARGWRGRILAWKGSWAQAESEYRYVLASAPSDVDIVAALADVLIWQKKNTEALQLLDGARTLFPSNPEVLSRRARVLVILGRTSEARAEFREVLAQDPQNPEARRDLKGIEAATRYELRVGEDVDAFNFTDAALAHSLSFKSRWSRRWSTLFTTSIYERFGETATKGTASATLRITSKDWISIGGAHAADHGIIPRYEAFYEYGHGFLIHNSFFRALESTYQQHWFWYRGAHVLTLGVSELLYLPHDWTWTVMVNGARSGFAGSGVEWVPSGATKLGFPLPYQFSGNVTFAVGSENFAQIDQIGRFSAHTYAGGLRYKITANQDISGYIAAQERTQNRSQNSYGVSYGIHF